MCLGGGGGGGRACFNKSLLLVRICHFKVIIMEGLTYLKNTSKTP